jgi:hypothetical protein
MSTKVDNFLMLHNKSNDFSIPSASTNFPNPGIVFNEFANFPDAPTALSIDLVRCKSFSNCFLR